MNRRHFSFGLLAATSALAITETAVAQSERRAAIPAAAYLAMALQGGTFLEEGARIAYDKTGAVPLKRFSRAEVVEQVNLSDKLNTVSDRKGIESAGAPGLPPTVAPSGPIGGLVTAPATVAGGVLTGAGTLVGGVIGGGAAVAMTTPAEKASTIAQLRSMPAGPAFDAMFVKAQLMGHQEALSIHDSYARNGSDADLRRIARGALPLIRQHIAFLSRMNPMS